MIEDISFTSINLVLSSWELARHNSGGDEQFGIDILTW